MMTEMLSLREAGKLNETQLKWFSDKPKEELYNRKTDPHNLNNLADNEDFLKQLKTGRNLLKTFKANHFEDRALQPEAEMVKTMWPNMQQPTTASVEVIIKNGLASLSTNTKGASMAYIISNKDNEKLDFNSGWQLYSEPISVEKGKTIYTIAERIGYKTSEIGMNKVE